MFLIISLTHAPCHHQCTWQDAALQPLEVQPEENCEYFPTGMMWHTIGGEDEAKSGCLWEHTPPLAVWGLSLLLWSAQVKSQPWQGKEGETNAIAGISLTSCEKYSLTAVYCFAQTHSSMMAHLWCLCHPLAVVRFKWNRSVFHLSDCEEKESPEQDWARFSLSPLSGKLKPELREGGSALCSVTRWFSCTSHCLHLKSVVSSSDNVFFWAREKSWVY